MPHKDRSNKDSSVEIHNDIDWPRCGDKLGGFSLVRPILSHAYGRREFVASYMDTVVRLMIEVQSSGIDIATEMQIRSFIDCDFIAKASELFTYDNHYHIFTIAVFDDIFSSNFSNFLQNKRIQAGATVTLLAPMAEALLMTHRKGIAHTQITQDNMYISTQGKPYLEGFNNCLILNAGDFGLVEQSKKATGNKQILAQKAKDLSNFAQFAKTVLVNHTHSKKINDYLELSIDQMTNAHHTQLSEIALEEDLERFIDAIFEWQSASSVFQQESNEPIIKQISPLGSERFFKQAHLDTKSNLLNFESSHLRADRHTQKSIKPSALQETGTKIKSIMQSVRPRYWIFLGACITVFIIFAFMLFLKPSQSTANSGAEHHSGHQAKVTDGSLEEDKSAAGKKASTKQQKQQRNQQIPHQRS